MTKSMAMTMMLSEAVGIEDDGNIKADLGAAAHTISTLLHSSTLISCLGVLFHVAE